jgi:hypothetical protein
VVEKSGVLDEEDEYEDEPTDPLSKLARGQEQILQEMETFKQGAKQDKEQEARQSVEDAANYQIREFAARAENVKPGLYQEAAAHLVNVKMAEIMEDNDDISVEDAQSQVTQWISNIKLKAVNSGKNPGEEFMRRSVLHGFKIEAPAAAKAPTKPTATNATEKIARERERKEGLASISTVSGSPANDPIKGLAGLSEKDRVRAIMAIQREKGQSRRPLPLGEILAHKIRK